MIEYSVLTKSEMPFVLSLVVTPFSYKSLLEEASFETLYDKFKNENRFSGRTMFESNGVYYQIYFQNKSDAMNFKLSFEPI